MLKLSRLPTGEPEIFVSIQGEGITMGVPSVFVRLSLCNLRCTWCDTKYTWDWARYDAKKEIIRVQIEDIVQRVSQSGVKNVVITGGEPMMQQREIVPLAHALKSLNHRLEIETNGTFAANSELADTIDQWNVSPKLENSGNSRAEREVAESLMWFSRQPNAFFKFVIADPLDLTEVDQLVARYEIPSERVLLMPESTDLGTLAQRSSWLVESCCQHGYRFTTRLHVALWGTQRGR
jgi:7-carboxy-7-deazaguanine synthase